MPSKKILHQSTAFFSQALAIHHNVSVFLQAGKPRPHTCESAHDSALHQGPRLFNPQAEHMAHFFAPVTLREISEILPGLKSNAVIVYSKESGVRMRDVYRDQGNPCPMNLVCDRRRYSLDRKS